MICQLMVLFCLLIAKILLAIKYPSLKPANPKDLEKLFITIKFLFLGTNFLKL